MSLDIDTAAAAPRVSVFKRRLQQQRERGCLPTAAVTMPLPEPRLDVEESDTLTGHERCVYTVEGHATHGSIYFIKDRVVIAYVGDTTKVCGAFKCKFGCMSDDIEGAFINVDTTHTQFDAVRIVPLGRDVLLLLRTPAALKSIFYKNETPQRLRV